MFSENAVVVTIIMEPAFSHLFEIVGGHLGLGVDGAFLSSQLFKLNCLKLPLNFCSWSPQADLQVFPTSST